MISGWLARRQYGEAPTLDLSILHSYVYSGALCICIVWSGHQPESFEDSYLQVSSSEVRSTISIKSWICNGSMMEIVAHCTIIVAFSRDQVSEVCCFLLLLYHLHSPCRSLLSNLHLTFYNNGPTAIADTYYLLLYTRKGPELCKMERMNITALPATIAENRYTVGCV